MALSVSFITRWTLVTALLGCQDINPKRCKGGLWGGGGGGAPPPRWFSLEINFANTELKHHFKDLVSSKMKVFSQLNILSNK
jgi:hypothetical protein